ncbi:MAG: hypothetical protein ACKOAP_03540 [Vulcanococcus sp.]
MAFHAKLRNAHGNALFKQSKVSSDGGRPLTTVEERLNGWRALQKEAPPRKIQPLEGARRTAIEPQSQRMLRLCKKSRPKEPSAATDNEKT